MSRFTAAPLTSTKKRRVAAYARVSTNNEEQLTSYEAQIDYYTTYIQGRDDWEFVGVYANEGITGTNTKKREQFNLMIADALAGKIDLIITKSVSRFARNTVDSLTTIRKLKENSVEVYFEKENIWTFDSKGELLLTIMSSLVQEESRSISENCTCEVTELIAERTSRRKQIEMYFRELRKQQPLETFREEDWLSMVDHMTVYSKDDIRVTFKDGTEIST